MVTYYIALVHKDLDSDYGVSFPDFPGCVTAGSTLAEAARMAEEALELHILGMIEDGDSIPEPRSIEEALATSDAEGALTPLPVPVHREKPSVERLNISLDSGLVRRIDAVADRHGLTRSGFIAQACDGAIRALAGTRESVSNRFQRRLQKAEPKTRRRK